MTETQTTDQISPSEASFEAYRQNVEKASQQLRDEVAERRRVESELRAYAQRLDHLRATQKAILSAQSLEDTLEITLRHIANSLPCISTAVVLYDFEHGTFEVLGSNRSEFKAGFVAPITIWDGIAKLRRGEHYYIRDVQEDSDSYPGMNTALEIGGRSVILVPLHYRDSLIGAMSITTGEVHEYTNEELVIAREIANSLAIAVQHRNWLTAEQEAREREATLRQIAESLAADLDLDGVLQEILIQLERLVPAVSSSIFLREGDQMRVAAKRDVRTTPEVIEHFTSNFPKFMADMMETGAPRIVKDTICDEDFVMLEGAEHVLSWMGVPLVAKGESLGILTMDRDQPNAFSDVDLDLALIIAAQAAIGIQNARLYRSEQDHATELERKVGERTKELQALYDISAASEILELEQLLDFSLNRALSAVGFSAGTIYLVDEENGTLLLAAAQGLPPGALALLDPETPTGQSYIKQLMELELPWSATGSEIGVQQIWLDYQSFTIVPLRAHGRSPGILTLMSEIDQTVQPGANKLLAAIADQIGLVVESAELRRHARQTAVLAERERIARDLHDVVTQSLYSLILFAEAARETAIAGDMGEVQKIALSIMQTAHQSLGEMRVLLYDLRSDLLAGKGLSSALAERLATVEQRAGVITELQAESADNLAPALEDVFYRLALEALNNSLRHSKAQAVSVHLNVTDDVAILRVVDNGTGFLVESVQSGPGTGLSNMRRRVREVGGTLNINSVMDQGTELEFRIPTSAPTTIVGFPLTNRNK